MNINSQYSLIIIINQYDQNLTNKMHKKKIRTQ